MNPPIKKTVAQCGTVNFFRNGVEPHVPLITIPLNITGAGETLLIIGRFVLSCRPDSAQGYPGFAHPYFSAGGLFLTAQDPSQLVDVPLSSGFFLDEPSGEDGWLGGGTDTSPMHPYTNHIRTAIYVTTAADVGQRWLTMLAWCSSSYAGQSDYLLNEQMEGSLSVLPMGSGVQAPVYVAPDPVVLSPPPPPPPPVAPPSPPPPPPPASGFDFQALWRRLLGK